MYQALPKNEKTFTIDMVGETSGAKFEGQFTTKCILDISEKHRRELEKTRLTADYANPSPGLAAIADYLSTLRAKLVKWPDWWENLEYGSKLKDENVLLALYDKIVELEAEWRLEVRKLSQPAEAKEAPQGNG